jgi:hypothetical protein
MHGAGKFLVLAGVLIALTGVAMMFGDRIPFLGRLPGDINVKRDGFELHLPLASSLVVSLLLTLVLWLTSYFREKP